MIIQTRYRDIPNSEVQKLHPANLGFAGDIISWEGERRGQPVDILTPATSDTGYCGGPFYQVAGHPLRWVCPHIAEIGD